MRASAFFEFGPPVVLQTINLAAPVPGPGDVLVRVAASTVNPTDVMMRAGVQVAMMRALAPPFVCGNEFAGHVEAVGAGVERLRPGEAVMGVVNPRRPLRGSHAELVCVPAASLTRVRSDADLRRAATIPMNGLTAIMALDALALPIGASLLVTGGAGALGGYVVQLAHEAGLRVIADALDTDVDLLSLLGAAAVVPRGPEMVAAVRSLSPGGVDGLVDCALLGDTAASLVRNDGAAVSVRSAYPIRDPRLRARNITVGDRLADTAALERLARAWEAGVLTPRVSRILPLEAAAEAHRLVEAGGLRGRVVLGMQP